MSFPRYETYKDSGVEWLGEVPEHWDVKRVKNNFRIVGGSTPKSDKEEYWDGQIVWITPSDLNNSMLDILTDSQRKITPEGLSSCGTALVPKGSIVLSTRAPIGSIGIAGTELCTNQGCKSLVPLTGINASYFAFVFTVTTLELNIRGRGTTFLELSGDQLGLFEIPTPSLVEQTNIVQFLDQETAKIDNLIAEQERLIALLKEKRQAVISHAVTKGLNPDVPMKDSGVEWLGEVPEHWGMVPLKYLCTFSGGGTPSKENLTYWTDGNIPWVSPKDMKSFWISDTQDKLTAIAVNESSTNYVESGALLMVVRSGILQRMIPIAINTVRVTLNQDMKALRFGLNMNVEYVANFILGYQSPLLLQWSKEGATVESIEHEYLSNSLFPIPPIEEQAKINESIKSKIDAFQNLEDCAVGVIALLKERRSALISSAVTGKIDVRKLNA
jgi:type I restriction enzyme S subunit